MTDYTNGIYSNKLRSKLYFYRDSNGSEVDLITDSGQIDMAIEINASQTYSEDFLKGIQRLQTGIDGYVIYQGKYKQKIDNITLESFSNLGKILKVIN